MINFSKSGISALACALLALGLRPASSGQSVYTYPYATSTLAGTVRTPGSADGTPGQFEFPFGAAVDAAGNIYIGDTNNDTIRKVTPLGVVSTLAGSANVRGSADGTGSAAQFYNPEGVAVDAAGNVYVADYNNDTIRKVTPAGVVTTLAGLAGTFGSTDGTGSAARFYQPAGVAVDAAGNVYVADTSNDTIRKITPAGVVTTIAGQAQVAGSADGAATAARFNLPSGVAVDGSGNIYVTDTSNDTVREISAAGIVTTVAGSAGATGSADGAGTAARFYLPVGIAVDGGGNVYIADTYNSTVRELTIAGTVSTIAGQPLLTGTVNGSGSSASFYKPEGLTVDSHGNIYIADTLNTVIRTAASGNAPVITTQPVGQSVTAGGSASFTVAATASTTIRYQWYLDGTAVPGATAATLSITEAGTNQAGNYTVAVANNSGSVTSSAAALTVGYTARLTNLSSRVGIGSGSNILIAGFGIGGTGSKTLLVRGVGPGLKLLNVPGTLLANPQLSLYDGNSLLIDTDIGWGNPAVAGTSQVNVSEQLATAAFMNSVGAFPLTAGSADGAMEVTPPVGSYSSQISGIGGTTGIALAEIYDADATTAPARLVNLSARAPVGTGSAILIAGFAIAGTTPETVLIRGVGPGLSAVFGLTGTLATPSLTLFDGNSVAIATNTGWNNASVAGSSTAQVGIQAATAAVFTTVGAFPLQPADSAMIAVLPPGSYTAEVSGTGNTTGIGMIEIYEIP